MEESLDDMNKRIGQELVDAVNPVCNDKRLATALIDLLNRTHPTLQQSLMGVFALVIEAHGKREYTDLRNEASVAWAKSEIGRAHV